MNVSSHIAFQIHRGDARRPRRDHPRQRARRRPQEAVQTPLQVRKRLPQPLPVLADQIGGLEGCVNMLVEQNYLSEVA